MARLLQIDVRITANRLVRSRKFINGLFTLKNAILTAALVCGNMSMPLILLIIWSRTSLPAASRLPSVGIVPKSHRLNFTKPV